VDMGEKRQGEMVRELYQVVIGIPENPTDNGLIGVINNIDKKLDALNGKVRGNEVRSKVNQGVLGSLVTGVMALAGKLLGWF